MLRPMVQKIFLITSGFNRRIRNFKYKILLKNMGKGCQICRGAVFAGAESISIGDRVIINEYVIIQGCNGAQVSIGDDVHISYGAKIITGGLDYAETSELRTHISKSISIRNGAWIGVNSVLLPGVTIGKNSVVAAGAIVTKSVEDNSVVAGVPAKVINNF